ncbi:MAG: tetratricopeptide repeat protein [Deltaproteobacteria bacterium]|nr:tetratricopeptide repeat protein [Deltaproteobacteria bacterium]
MSKHIDYEINRELGECYLFMGELDKAETYYRKAVECGCKHTDAFFGLAAISIKRGRLDEAGGHYRDALALAPEEDKALTGLGLVEIEQGAAEEAFAHLHAALNLNPGNLIAMNALLQLSYRMERVDEMFPHLKRALQEEDNNSIRFILAGCLSYLGRNEEAREHLEILLGRDPSNSEAQELYAHIAA